MPTAKKDFTSTSVRSVNDGAGMALLGGATTAGSSKAAEPDAHLLALAAELAAIDAKLAAANADPATMIDDAFRGLLDDYWHVARQIEQIPARTPEGIRAKARVLRSVYAGTEGDEDSHVSRHLAGLLRDLLGEH